MSAPKGPGCSVRKEDMKMKRGCLTAHAGFPGDASRVSVIVRLSAVIS